MLVAPSVASAVQPMVALAETDVNADKYGAYHFSFDADQVSKLVITYVKPAVAATGTTAAEDAVAVAINVTVNDDDIVEYTFGVGATAAEAQAAQQQGTLESKYETVINAASNLDSVTVTGNWKGLTYEGATSPIAKSSIDGATGLYAKLTDDLDVDATDFTIISDEAAAKTLLVDFFNFSTAATTNGAVTIYDADGFKLYELKGGIETVGAGTYSTIALSSVAKT